MNLKLSRMNICLGFFGFTRKMITSDDFTKFMKILPPDSNIDIFICCPSKMDEILDDTIDEVKFKEYIQTVFKNKLINFKFYEYDPFEFIIKSRKIYLPDYIINTKLYTFRILSLHFSISLLSTTIHEHMIKENKEYDSIILTRFDIFPLIQSLGDCLMRGKEPVIYIWRTCPYNSIDDAEDRIIITSKYGLEKLKNLYNIYDSIPYYKSFDISIDNFYPEYIIGKYLNRFDEILKLPQKDIILGLSPYMNAKYSSNNTNHYNRLLEICTFRT